MDKVSKQGSKDAQKKQKTGQKASSSKVAKKAQKKVEVPKKAALSDPDEDMLDKTFSRFRGQMDTAAQEEPKDKRAPDSADEFDKFDKYMNQQEEDPEDLVETGDNTNQKLGNTLGNEQ